LDKRDGIFLIGEKCLYVIENYIIEAGCIKEKLEERDLSVIDRALGVRTNSAGVADIHSTKQLETMDNAWPGGRAWAYSGGAWGKEKVGFFISFSFSFFLILRFAVFLWFFVNSFTLVQYFFIVIIFWHNLVVIMMHESLTLFI
jgi:hypothetical protein